MIFAGFVLATMTSLGSALVASSVFECAEKVLLPTSQMGSIPYTWVATGAGQGIVVVRFRIAVDGTASSVLVDTKSNSIMGRWVGPSVEESTFKRACAGQRFKVKDIVVVHKKTSVDLPTTTIGPGNCIRLEYLEVDSGPLLPRPQDAKWE